MDLSSAKCPTCQRMHAFTREHNPALAHHPAPMPYTYNDSTLLGRLLGSPRSTIPKPSPTPGHLMPLSKEWEPVTSCFYAVLLMSLHARNVPLLPTRQIVRIVCCVDASYTCLPPWTSVIDHISKTVIKMKCSIPLQHSVALIRVNWPVHFFVKQEHVQQLLLPGQQSPSKHNSLSVFNNLFWNKCLP